MAEEFNIPFEVMATSTYTDKRLLNMAKQSYNFQEDIVKEVTIEILKRKLMEESNLEALLQDNHAKQQQQRAKNHAQLLEVRKHNPEEHFENEETAFSKNLKRWGWLILIAASILIFIFTGYIWIVLLGIGGAGATAYGSKKRFLGR